MINLQTCQNVGFEQNWVGLFLLSQPGFIPPISVSYVTGISDLPENRRGWDSF